MNSFLKEGGAVVGIKQLWKKECQLGLYFLFCFLLYDKYWNLINCYVLTCYSYLSFQVK